MPEIELYRGFQVGFAIVIGMALIVLVGVGIALWQEIRRGD